MCVCNDARDSFTIVKSFIILFEVNHMYISQSKQSKFFLQPFLLAMFCMLVAVAVVEGLFGNYLPPQEEFRIVCIVAITADKNIFCM